MTGINLRVATLKNAKLKNCNLRGATLAGTDLEVRKAPLRTNSPGPDFNVNITNATVSLQSPFQIVHL